MHIGLTDEQKLDFLKRGFTRRTLGRVAAMMAAGATIPFYNESALAQLSAVRGTMSLSCFQSARPPRMLQRMSTQPR